MTTSKPTYERPVIVRHEMGLMNKFGRVQSMRPRTEIDGVPVETLIETYGSPLFVFSERTLRLRYREMHDAYARRWPRVRMTWSYKTNYNEAICRVFHQEGAWAEVVSGFEMEKAIKAGIAPDRIHFNGPYKPYEVLDKALPAGTMVHLDHFDEMALAEQVAEAHNIRPGVAIRLNMATTGTPPWSRFGFNLENGQALEAVKRLLAGDRLRLVGLHCHMGTFILEPDSYKEQAAKLAAFANDLRKRFGVKIEFIDLGGGIPSHNTLKAQYLMGEQATPSFTAYAEAVMDGLATLDCPPSELPTLVLENGRALVDDAGYLVSTVLANKRLPDGRRGVVLDAGVNTLFTSFWYRHDVLPAQSFRGMPEPTVMYGPLCMNIDVMRDTLLFPALGVGDKVVFHNVGAYNMTQWMQFITYRPPAVLIAKDGRHGLIRRGEHLEDVTGPEEVPSWL